VYSHATPTIQGQATAAFDHLLGQTITDVENGGSVVPHNGWRRISPGSVLAPLPADASFYRASTERPERAISHGTACQVFVWWCVVLVRGAAG
jgi:hypothetical protein